MMNSNFRPFLCTVFTIALLTYPYKKGFKKKLSFEDFHNFREICPNGDHEQAYLLLTLRHYKFDLMNISCFFHNFYLMFQICDEKGSEDFNRFKFEITYSMTELSSDI